MSWKVPNGAGLVLTGAPQRLSDIYGGAVADKVGGKLDLSYSHLFLQADGANANPIYLGDADTVSSTSYGIRIEKANAGVPPNAIELVHGDAGVIKLSQIWVVGTAAEVLRVAGVPA